MRLAYIKRVDGKTDEIMTYNVNDFPYQALNIKALKSKHKKSKASEYIYQFATFDIETTTIIPENEDDKPFGFMYHWQMCVAGIPITGRRWEEWVKFMTRLSDIYRLNPDRRFVIYIHNEGFEYEFMYAFLAKYFGGITVFARSHRKPIHVTTGNGFEFRCSYMLTNMSLEKACENELGIIHPKAAGDLDYKKLRTAETFLDDTEFGYCISDVVSLYELIDRRLYNEKDTLESIPLTSTGYVRRDCRKACLKNKRYHEQFVKLEMTLEVYTMLKEAGRGGNTHANRFMSGRIWENADSYDKVSSYPAQICMHEFPITKFEPYGEIESIEEFRKLLSEYACLFRITFTDIKVKQSTPMPYIPVSKCSHINNERLDNGRVLKASTLTMTVTDIDFKIIEDEYNFSGFFIEDMHIAKYGMLPEELRGAVMHYFELKCELKEKIKNVEALLEHSENPTEIAALEAELEELNYFYAKAKNKLNGIFGMCFTDPVRPIIECDDTGRWLEERMPENLEEVLHKACTSRNSFLFYAWGVWCTSWARFELEELINATQSKHAGHCIYVDTDSSKCVGSDPKEIEKLNEKIISLADKTGAYCDYNGTRYYLGICEHENAKPIKKFKTLGAKKYCYVDADNKLHVTISGVNKKKGSVELKKIENFRPGFIFEDAGGTTLFYNDEDIHQITIDGCTMTTAGNIGIVDSTYKLGITGEYAELIGYNVYEDIETY